MPMTRVESLSPTQAGTVPVYKVSIILLSPFRLLSHLLGHFFSLIGFSSISLIILHYSPPSILPSFILFPKMKAVLDDLIKAAMPDSLRDKCEINSDLVYRKLKDDRAYKRIMRTWERYDGYGAESYRGESAKL
jgi:hypothetical protein